MRILRVFILECWGGGGGGFIGGIGRWRGKDGGKASKVFFQWGFPTSGARVVMHTYLTSLFLSS